ncbi:hypothetical protein [Pseudomonas sp. GM_Psu_2]|uniref:hypothetical protein n=1 Tax=unclassified Pseudomonas TaxID=196821 RepID=UPI002269997C|nr:hypothetical protein [Pseudomonas sp. GM_Psu_2]
MINEIGNFVFWRVTAFASWPDAAGLIIFLAPNGCCHLAAEGLLGLLHKVAAELGSFLPANRTCTFGKLSSGAYGQFGGLL